MLSAEIDEMKENWQALREREKSVNSEIAIFDLSLVKKEEPENEKVLQKELLFVIF
jgi:hypothetical protein